MSGITVLRAGACDTVQDQGRRGLLSQGFSASGCMDQRSAFIANALVGNPSSCAVLECAYTGPTLRFEEDAVISIAGAPFDPALNGEALESYCTHLVHAGDVLNMGRAQAGVYGYLAVAGGIAVTSVLNSRSTSMRYGIGGVEGRRLHGGDVLPLVADPAIVRAFLEARLRSHDAYFSWDAQGPRWIRVVVPNPHGPMAWEPLFERAFVVQAESDRMGLRIDGGTVAAPTAADLVSEALVRGTIQVPASGQPLIAMADHQTTGGYLKAGVVAGVDLPRLAQCRPGTSLRFEPIDVASAQRMLRRDARYLQALARGLRACGSA